MLHGIWWSASAVIVELSYLQEFVVLHPYGQISVICTVRAKQGKKEKQL